MYIICFYDLIWLCLRIPLGSSSVHHSPPPRQLRTAYNANLDGSRAAWCPVLAFRRRSTDLHRLWGDVDINIM